MSDVKFCLINPHDPGTLHSKDAGQGSRAISSGMNVRPAHATMARFVSICLAAASVQVPAPEAREALAKGTADAITFPWNSIYIFGIDSETKFSISTCHSTSLHRCCSSTKAKYDGLAPEDLKQVIDDHCTPDWSQKFSDRLGRQ